MKAQRQRERGSSLIEVLFALILFSIMGLGFAMQMISASHAKGRNLVNSLALEIAHETLEDLAAVDPESLSDATDVENEAVSRGGRDFLRSIDVTIEAVWTRSVEVRVVNPAFSVEQEVTAAFALWNRR